MKPDVISALVEDRINESRPGSVMLAVWALGLSGILGLLQGFMGFLVGLGFAGTIGGKALLLALLVPVVLLVYLQFCLLKGRMFIWVVAIHLALLLLAVPLWSLYLLVPYTSGGLSLEQISPRMLTQAVCAAIALIMLLMPSSCRWYSMASRLRRKQPDTLEDYVKSLKTPARLTLLVALVAGLTARAEEPVFSSEAIFPPEKKHNHASCVVELPGGDLLTVWYNGTGERRADDVIIQAARLKKGEKEWGPRFLLADTPGYPDCNPAIFAAPDQTLWLLYPTILDHRWEGALLKFAVATEYPDAGRPGKWDREGVLHITPEPRGFETAMAEALQELEKLDIDFPESEIQAAETRSKDLLYQRLGWMPRVHPTVLPNGRWLWPLYCDTFSCSIIAISDDQGKTWKASAPIIGFGNIQPSLVRKNDGTVVAYMRDNGPFRRIRVSTSKDNGETWSKVFSSDLPNPGAGIEAIRLASGKWAMIYNDTERGRHSLALSLSDDEGESWKWTRHVARGPAGQQSFHYPSITQGADGTIHMTYTNGGLPEGSTIRHARCNEAWVMQGDGDGASR
jgi:predicted neuraminidase